MLQHARDADFAVLVNNEVGWSYGVNLPGSMAIIGETPTQLWREVRINLDSVYFVPRRVAGFLKRGGGGIVVSRAAADCAE